MSAMVVAAPSSSSSSSELPCYVPQDIISLLLGIGLLLGGLVSFVPQWVVIIRRRTSNGLSYGFLALGVCASAASSINKGMLQWGKITCCHTMPLPLGQCLENTLPFMQIFSGLIWYLILYTLFIVYCRADGESFPRAEARRQRTRSSLLFVFILLVVSLVAMTAGVLYYNFDVGDHVANVYAQVVGYVGAVFTGAQYAPQIYVTFKLRSAGSLSLGTLLIQLLGNVLIIIYQGVLQGEHFSAWVPNVFAFLQILTLLLLLLGLWLKSRGSKRERKALLDMLDGDEADVDADRAALLDDSRPASAANLGVASLSPSDADAYDAAVAAVGGAAHVDDAYSSSIN